MDENKLSEVFARTLIVAPHYDDDILGCGGLLNRLAKTSNYAKIVVCVSNYRTSTQTRSLEELSAISSYRASNIELDSLSGLDGNLSNIGHRELCTQLDEIIKEYKPTAVLFPYKSFHQDHEFLHKVMQSVLRPSVATNFIKLKAMYEYPYVTSDGMLGVSGGKMYIELSEDDINAKLTALDQFSSQLNRDPSDPLDVSASLDLAKVRGREIGKPYAEVYYPLSIVY